MVLWRDAARCAAVADFPAITAAIELVLLAVMFGIPSLDLPLDHVAGALALDAVANGAVARWLSRGRAVSRTAAAIVLGIEMLLASYLSYYHGARTHLALAKDAPTPRGTQPPMEGRVVAFPEVGSLHHRYERCAA